MLSPRCSPEKLASGQLSTSCRQNEDSQKSSIHPPSPRGSIVSSSHPLKRISTSPSPSPPSAGPPNHPSGQGPQSSTFKSKPTLAQEIYDEFLVCKICLDAFKNPKCLDCLHTFCEHCIEAHVQSESTYKKYSDYREFTCPLCRKRTQLPIGGVKKLPDNFLVSNLSEMVGRRRLTKFPFCDICKMVDQKFREGTAKCLDCAKMLCPSCVVAHQEIKVTSGHSIFDIEIEKNIGCYDHPDEMVRFYCEPCELCICILCAFKGHRQHKVTQFSEAVTGYKVTMETMVDHCLEKMDQFDRHITSLDRCEKILMTVRQQIKETAASFVQEIELRERQLLTELDSMYGGDCLEYIDRKQDLSNQVENIRSTCKLAKTILGGKDIELLLMRKDVQEKLASLNTVELKQLPKTVSKIVEFVMGEVNFGYLLDRDRPLLTTMSMRKKSSENPSEESRLKGTAKPVTKDIGQAKSSSRSDTSSDDIGSSSDSDSSSEDSTEGTFSGRRDLAKGKVHRGTLVHRSTMTDEVVLADKAVNTKARSMLNSSSGGSGGGRHPSVEQQREDWNDHGAADKKTRKREKMAPGQTTIIEIDSLNWQPLPQQQGREVILDGGNQTQG